jgi:heme oxygenase
MASLTASLYQIQSNFHYKNNKPLFSLSSSPTTHQFRSNFFIQKKLSLTMPRKESVIVVSATTAEKKRHPGESKGFVEEMRFVAMRLHTKDQAKEGEKEVKEPEEKAVTKWEPTVDGYLRFLVDSKIVYDTLEKIVQDAAYPYCKTFFLFFLMFIIVI